MELFKKLEFYEKKVVENLTNVRLSKKTLLLLETLEERGVEIGFDIGEKKILLDKIEKELLESLEQIEKSRKRLTNSQFQQLSARAEYN